MGGIVQKILGGGGGGGGGLSQSEVDARVVAVASGRETFILKPEEQLNGSSASVPARTYTSISGAFHRTYQLAYNAFTPFVWVGKLPDRWDEGTIRWRFVWFPDSTNVGTVIVALQYSVAGDGEAIPSQTSAGSVTDTSQGAADRPHTSPWSSDITLTGATSEDMLILEWFRGNSDTFTGNAELEWIEIEWTSDAPNDD